MRRSGPESVIAARARFPVLVLFAVCCGSLCFGSYMVQARTSASGVIEDGSLRSELEHLPAILTAIERGEFGATRADKQLAREGALNFFAPFPGGNGRACATCHNPSDGYSISPRTVEARWQALQRSPCGSQGRRSALSLDRRRRRQGRLHAPSHARALQSACAAAGRVRLVDAPGATHVRVSRAAPPLSMLAIHRAISAGPDANDPGGAGARRGERAHGDERSPDGGVPALDRAFRARAVCGCRVATDRRGVGDGRPDSGRRSVAHAPRTARQGALRLLLQQMSRRTGAGRQPREPDLPALRRQHESGVAQRGRLESIASGPRQTCSRRRFRFARAALRHRRPNRRHCR